MVAEASAQWHFKAPAANAFDDIRFDAPPWTTGNVAVNVDVEAITNAIARLATALRGEIEARVDLETRVETIGGRAAEAHQTATEAKAAVSSNFAEANVYAPEDEGGAVKASRAPEWGRALHELQSSMARVEQDLLHHKRHQEQKSRAADEILRLKLEALSREVESRVRVHDMRQHADSVLSQVKALVDEESRGVVRAALADDIDRVHSSINTVSDALSEQHRLLEERVDALAARKPGALGLNISLGEQQSPLEKCIDKPSAPQVTSDSNVGYSFEESRPHTPETSVGVSGPEEFLQSSTAGSRRGSVDDRAPSACTPILSSGNEIVAWIERELGSIRAQLAALSTRQAHHTSQHPSDLAIDIASESCTTSARGAARDKLGEFDVLQNSSLTAKHDDIAAAHKQPSDSSCVGAAGSQCAPNIDYLKGHLIEEADGNAVELQSLAGKPASKAVDVRPFGEPVSVQKTDIHQSLPGVLVGDGGQFAFDGESLQRQLLEEINRRFMELQKLLNRPAVMDMTDGSAKTNNVDISVDHSQRGVSNVQVGGADADICVGTQPAVAELAPEAGRAGAAGPSHTDVTACMGDAPHGGETLQIGLDDPRLTRLYNIILAQFRADLAGHRVEFEEHLRERPFASRPGSGGDDSVARCASVDNGAEIGHDFGGDGCDKGADGSQCNRTSRDAMNMACGDMKPWVDQQLHSFRLEMRDVLANALESSGHHPGNIDGNYNHGILSNTSLGNVASTTKDNDSGQLLQQLETRVSHLESVSALRTAAGRSGRDALADRALADKTMNSIASNSSKVSSDIEPRLLELEAKVALPREQIKRMEARMAGFERSIAGLVHNGSDLGGGNSNAPLGLNEELQRLKERLAHIEKIRHGDGNHDASELPNILRAVRGVQKDADITSSKLSDVSAGLKDVRSKVDVALPRLFQLLEQSKPSFSQSCDSSDDAVVALDSAIGELNEGAMSKALHGLRELFGDGSVPKQFVSLEDHAALRRLVEDLGADVRGQLGNLRGNVSDALRSKADREDIQALLAKQQALGNVLAHQHFEGPSVEDPAVHRVQLLPARCISCDQRIEFKAGKPHPCHGMMPSWDKREGSCAAHQPAGPPPGYRQRRSPSLPPVI